MTHDFTNIRQTIELMHGRSMRLLEALSDTQIALIHVYNKLSEEDRAMVLKVLLKHKLENFKSPEGSQDEQSRVG